VASASLNDSNDSRKPHKRNGDLGKRLKIGGYCWIHRNPPNEGVEKPAWGYLYGGTYRERDDLCDID
jgi:hypothetical protein